MCDIPECFRDEFFMIKCYTSLHLLYFTLHSLCYAFYAPLLYSRTSSYCTYPLRDIHTDFNVESFTHPDRKFKCLGLSTLLLTRLDVRHSINGGHALPF